MIATLENDIRQMFMRVYAPMCLDEPRPVTILNWNNKTMIEAELIKEDNLNVVIKLRKIRDIDGHKVVWRVSRTYQPECFKRASDFRSSPLDLFNLDVFNLTVQTRMLIDHEEKAR